MTEEQKARWAAYKERVKEEPAEPAEPEQAAPGPDPAPERESFGDSAGEVERLANVLMQELKEGDHPYILLSTAVEVVAHALDNPLYRTEAQAYINGLYLLDGSTWEELAGKGFAATGANASDARNGVIEHYKKLESRLKRMQADLNRQSDDMLATIMSLREARQDMEKYMDPEPEPHQPEQQQLNID